MPNPDDHDPDALALRGPRPLADLLGAAPRALTTGRAPVPRLPHLEHPDFVTRHVGTDEPDDLVQLFIFRDVLAELRYRSEFAPHEASACLLTGGWFLGPHGPYVEIDGFRDTVAVDGAMALVNYLRAHRELVSAPPAPVPAAELVVGCCQLRPGCAGRFAPEDLILLNTFFPRPYHVMLMVDPSESDDPARGQLGFYVRSGAGQIVNAPFVLVAAADEDEPGTAPGG